MFVDIILDGGERGDEAMYYLLHQRLERQLRGRFEVFQSCLSDSFEDVVEDFFLYLREGKSGQNRVPYQSLRRIRKKDSFEAWMLNTFRNYLTVRAAKEDGRTIRLSDNQNIQISENPNTLTDERKLAIASSLIAYTHQLLRPRERFIFLRTLLTLLNKQQALPNDELALALGMTGVSYRVAVYRLRCTLANIRERILQGENLCLDDFHRKMAQKINDDFDRLYPTIAAYYIHSLEHLECADSVKRLREEHCASTGTMLHESGLPYSIAPSISAFWIRLSRFLIV